MARVTPHEVERRVEAIQRALAEAWAFPEGLAVAASELSALAPGYRGMIHFREPDGEFSDLGIDVHGSMRSAWADLPVSNTLERLKLCLGYRFDGPDPHTGKVVTISQIFPDEERRQEYHELLDDNGFADPLRVLLRRRGRMRVWFGVMRVRGSRARHAEISSQLARLIPALEDATRAADLTRYGRADVGTLQPLLDALQQPVWLVTGRGTIAYASEVARVAGREAAAEARRAAAVAGDPRFTIARVSIEGDALTLVMGKVPTTHRALPASLARVADGIARGATDKQIAVALELPLATVRTYVRRCYARLGVHNRVELATAWRVHDFSATSPPTSPSASDVQARLPART